MKDIKHGTKLVPKLRFKEFDGEWKKDSTKKLVSFIKDGTHGTHKDTPNGEYYLLSAKNIINGSVVITEDERKISKSEFDKITSSYKLEENDILLTIVGSIGQLALYKGHSNCAFQRSVAFLRFGRIDANYAFHYLNSYYYQKELLKRKVTSAQPGIYLGELAKIEVPFPTIPEQQKIASFLTAVDKRIEQLTKKKKLLEEYKKGVMQKIFNQEIRFKDENGNDFPEWEEKRLGEICNLQGGYAFKSESYTRSGIPIIRISNIPINGYFVDVNEVRYYERFENDNDFIISKGDILIALSGATTGKIGVYNSNNNAYLNQRVGVFRSKKGVLKSLFLTKYLFSPMFQNELSKFLVAGAQPNISPKDIHSIRIRLPIPKEQDQISQYLDAIDSTIEACQSTTKIVNSFKSGLLQQMFI